MEPSQSEARKAESSRAREAESVAVPGSGALGASKALLGRGVAARVPPPPVGLAGGHKKESLGPDQLHPAVQIISPPLLAAAACL